MWTLFGMSVMIIFCLMAGSGIIIVLGPHHWTLWIVVVAICGIQILIGLTVRNQFRLQKVKSNED